MKLTLTAITALVVLTGAASASDFRKWPCTELHANWMHAPQKQCGRVLGNGGQNIGRGMLTAVVEVPTDVAIVQ